MNVKIGDVVRYYYTNKDIEGTVAKIEELEDRTRILIRVSYPEDFEGHNGDDYKTRQLPYFEREKMWWVGTKDLKILSRLDENLI